MAQKILLGNVRGPRGETGSPGKFGKASATVDGEYKEVPEVTVDLAGEAGDQTLTFSFSGLRGLTGRVGPDGLPGNFSSVTATADGIYKESPTVDVVMGGKPGSQTVDFAFSGLRGPQGEKGEQGEPSYAFHIIDVAESVDDLAGKVETATAGDAYVIKETNEVWVFNGKEFISLGSALMGPQGFPGKDGEDGEDGTDGAPGRDAHIESVTATVEGEYTENPTCEVTVGEGYNNAQTLAFAFNGLRGQPGKNGENGQDGAEGPQGPQGDPGIDGNTIHVKGYFDTLESLKTAHKQGMENDTYNVGGDLYVWSPEQEEWTLLNLDVVALGEVTGSLTETGEFGEPSLNVTVTTNAESGDKDVVFAFTNLKGQPSYGWRILDKVLSYDDLKPLKESAQLGDAYIVDSTHEVWVFNGTDFISLGNAIQGPRGEAGKPGKDGEPGRDGVDGNSITIQGSFDSYEELTSAKPEGSQNDIYIVNGDMYAWDPANSKWVKLNLNVAGIGQVTGSASVTYDGETNLQVSFTDNEDHTAKNLDLDLTIEYPPDFTGATIESEGTKGLVPAPSVGDVDKVLQSDGNWIGNIFNGITTSNEALSKLGIEELSSKVESLIVQLEEKDAEIKALQTKVSETTKELQESIATNQSETNTTLTSLQEQITGNDGDITALQESLATTTSATNKSIAALNKQVTSAQLAKVDLNTLHGKEYWDRRFFGAGNHGCTNGASAAAFSLTVLRAAAGYTKQLWQTYSQPDLYERHCEDAKETWSEWKLVGLDQATLDKTYVRLDGAITTAEIDEMITTAKNKEDE